MIQQETAQKNQFLASTGQGGPGKSTTDLGIGTQIDTNALMAAGQFQHQAVSDYVSTFGEYSKLMDKGIQAQIQGDNQLMTLWSTVLGGLAKAQASSSSGGGGGGGGGDGGGLGGVIGAVASIASLFA